MSETFRITVRPDATVEAIYADALRPVFAALGAEPAIVRASEVEPHPTKPGWLADMRRSGGPVLGANGSATIPARNVPAGKGSETLRGIVAEFDTLDGFETRQAALEAEIAWLTKYRNL